MRGIFLTILLCGAAIGAAGQPFPADDGWWRSFGDPVLDSLIVRAERNNPNAAVALKRIEAGRRMIQETRAGYFPSIGLSAGWTQEQPAGGSGHNSYFSAGAQMSWQIDIFGKVRAAVKAQKAAYNASRADYAGMLVSLAADVATAYMDLCTTRRQLQVAERHIESQQQIVRIAEARFEAELGSMLDVTQARIVLLNTQSSLPALRAKAASLVNTIAVYVGQYPGSPLPGPEADTVFPVYAGRVPYDVPADLLRRRPDVVSAEKEIDQCAALLGVARKEYLPSLTLTGTIATESRRVDGLFGKHSLTYRVAPQLSWTLFDGGARRARTAQARLQLEEAVDSYNMTLLNAVEEVNNALLQYDGTMQTIEVQRRVVEQSRKSLDLALDLYKTGLTAFSNVVDGQMNWLESENTLAGLEGSALTALVSIYQALGGGFGYNDDFNEK